MFHSSRTSALPRMTMLVWLLVLGLAPVGTSASPDDRFAQIFNRTLLKQQSIHSVRARFTETTTSSLLATPLVAHGTLIGARPARVRMTYTDPEAKTILIDSKTLTIVWPDRHEHEQIDIAETQKRIEQDFTHASLDDLRAMFQIAIAPDTVVQGTDRIEMIPRRKSMKAGLARLDLWINRETDLLVQLRLIFRGGDQKTITLDDIVVNVPVTDEMFTTP